MTKQEFDQLFERCVDKHMVADADTIQVQIGNYADKDGKVSGTELAAFAYIESMKYTNEMIYAVLSEALAISD